MLRLTKDEYGCMLTIVGKARSEDPHTHCSAVAMSKEGRILGISYNGLKGGHNIEPWMLIPENREKKAKFFFHAETNLFSLIKGGECDTIYLNWSPCIECARIIAANNVRRVVYLKEYWREVSFKELFEGYGIMFERLNKESKARILQYMTNMDNLQELM